MNNHQRFHVSSHCTPYLVLYTRKCIGCWQCLTVCPRQVLGSVRFLWHRHVVVKNGMDCIGCKKCMQVCPQQVFVECVK